MKPIITDMNEMSDSTELYESRPNRFLIYTIYVIFLLLIVAVLWMGISKIDIVVKSNGIFRSSENVYEVGNGVTGCVKECFVENGQKVKEGELLFTLGNEMLDESIQAYQTKLEKVQQRIKVLEAYEKSLDGDEKAFDGLKENPYYDEIINRKKLFEENQKTGQQEIYQNSIRELKETVEQIQKKIQKLQQVKANIFSRTNTFGDRDGYYSSMVKSYISSYHLMENQYDTQIKEYQGQSEIEEEKIKSLQAEKKDALANLELQQIARVEQLIEEANTGLTSQQLNLSSMQMELKKNGDSKTAEDILRRTEKSNVSSELLACRKEADEYESYLKNYQIQGQNCNVFANASGYFYMEQELSTGTYIQEGTSIGTIYPEKTGGYYAEVYVDNADIGKIVKGQKVKFEIPAYPSSEYGYFTGEIVDIPKDISVNQNNGSAYYVVKAVCDSGTIQNQSGEKANIMNGMSCQAKMIVEEKNVLKYVLEKIDLVD